MRRTKICMGWRDTEHAASAGPFSSFAEGDALRTLMINGESITCAFHGQRGSLTQSDLGCLGGQRPWAERTLIPSRQRDIGVRVCSESTNVSEGPTTRKQALPTICLTRHWREWFGPGPQALSLLKLGNSLATISPCSRWFVKVHHMRFVMLLMLLMS